MDPKRYSLEDTPPLLPLPLMYMMAMEIGDWRNAATACTGMIRAGGDCELWYGRLQGVQRRVASIHRRTDGGRVRGVVDHVRVETAID